MSKISSNQDIGRILLGPWTRYCPFQPSPKQLAFSMLPHREAFCGGAAGGGKTGLMVMDALKYVHIPKYSAIIFRRTLGDHEQAGGPLDLAMQWLSPYLGSEVRYRPSLHTFEWYNGATLRFGYIGSSTAWEHIQGGNYQYIGWDEITQHSDLDYGEMFSRLRRNGCREHGSREIDGKPAPLPPDPNCNLCQLYSQLERVPLRIRCTGNPGGRGHHWVKKHFKLYKNMDLINPISGKPGIWLSRDPDRPFVPFFHVDNPGLDPDYKKSLEAIPDENRRAQLLMGDWDQVANGIFKTDWFLTKWKYMGGYYAIVSPSGARTHSYHEKQLRIYTVVDVACSVREGVGDRSFKQSGGTILPASWTAICTFGMTPKNELLVLDMQRFQKEAPDIFDELKKVTKKWSPMFIAMEVNGPGKPLAQMALQMGFAIKEVVTYMDKPSNSVEAQIRCRAGKVLLPEKDATLWLDDFIGELVCWTGHPHEINDQVDVLSNGVHEFTRMAGNMDRDAVNVIHARDLPKVSRYNPQMIHFPDAGSFGPLY